MARTAGPRLKGGDKCGVPGIHCSSCPADVESKEVPGRACWPWNSLIDRRVGDGATASQGRTAGLLFGLAVPGTSGSSSVRSWLSSVLLRRGSGVAGLLRDTGQTWPRTLMAEIGMVSPKFKNLAMCAGSS